MNVEFVKKRNVDVWGRGKRRRVKRNERWKVKWNVKTERRKDHMRKKEYSYTSLSPLYLVWDEK